ncbi:MAG: cell division protein ZapA [Rubrivivax sp.]
MKQVEVTILGQGYLLGCPEGGEEPLRAAVAMVDREMSTIRDAGRIRARERIAVLAALNLAYQLAQGARGAAAPAPEAAGAPGPGEGVPGTSERPDPDLQALIARLDAALQRDGHLL